PSRAWRFESSPGHQKGPVPKRNRAFLFWSWPPRETSAEERLPLGFAEAHQHAIAVNQDRPLDQLAVGGEPVLEGRLVRAGHRLLAQLPVGAPAGVEPFADGQPAEGNPAVELGAGRG